MFTLAENAGLMPTDYEMDYGYPTYEKCSIFQVELC
jgi:hypothetical protein